MFQRQLQGNAAGNQPVSSEAHHFLFGRDRRTFVNGRQRSLLHGFHDIFFYSGRLVLLSVGKCGVCIGVTSTGLTAVTGLISAASDCHSIK